jgi:hypothetical protein
MGVDRSLAGGGNSGSVPLAKFQHPSHALLEENGFKQVKYTKWFKRCIEERSAKGAAGRAGWGLERFRCLRHSST